MNKRVHINNLDLIGKQMNISERQKFQSKINDLFIKFHCREPKKHEKENKQQSAKILNHYIEKQSCQLDVDASMCESPTVLQTNIPSYKTPPDYFLKSTNEEYTKLKFLGFNNHVYTDDTYEDDQHKSDKIQKFLQKNNSNTNHKDKSYSILNLNDDNPKEFENCNATYSNSDDNHSITSKAVKFDSNCYDTEFTRNIPNTIETLSGHDKPKEPSIPYEYNNIYKSTIFINNFENHKDILLNLKIKIRSYNRTQSPVIPSYLSNFAKCYVSDIDLCYFQNNKNTFIPNLSEFLNKMRQYGNVLKFHGKKSTIDNKNINKKEIWQKRRFFKKENKFIDPDYTIKTSGSFFGFNSSLFELFSSDKNIYNESNNSNLHMFLKCNLSNSICVRQNIDKLCETCFCINLFIEFCDIDIFSNTFNIKKHLRLRTLSFGNLPAFLWFIFSNIETHRELSIRVHIDNFNSHNKKDGNEYHKITKAKFRYLFWRNLAYILNEGFIVEAPNNEINKLNLSAKANDDTRQKPTIGFEKLKKLEETLTVFICNFYFTHYASVTYAYVLKNCHVIEKYHENNALLINFICLYSDLIRSDDKKIHINADLTLNIGKDANMANLNIFQAYTKLNNVYTYQDYAFLYLRFIANLFSLGEKSFFENIEILNQQYLCKYIDHTDLNMLETPNNQNFIVIKPCLDLIICTITE